MDNVRQAVRRINKMAQRELQASVWFTSLWLTLVYFSSLWFNLVRPGSLGSTLVYCSGVFPAF